MPRVLLALLIVSAVTAAAHAGEIDFVEDFALSQDRSVPLKQLIPGTEDYYYYHALDALNREQYEKVREFMGPWAQRHGETPRVWEIRTRLALLSYENAPEKSLEYLRQRLGLTYPHQKEDLNAEPNLPIALDQALITRKAYKIGRAHV